MGKFCSFSRVQSWRGFDPMAISIIFPSDDIFVGGKINHPSTSKTQFLFKLVAQKELNHLNFAKEAAIVLIVFIIVIC